MNRHLGKGMKPRGVENKAGSDEPSEEAVCSEPEQPQFSDVIENKGTESEPILSPGSDVTPHRVEVETEPVQHVAETSGFGEVPPAVPEDVFSHLETLMRQSREATGSNPAFLDPPVEPITNPGPGNIYIPTLEEIKALTGSLGEPGERVFPDPFEHLGLQPNGDYKAVVTVREGYWPLVEAGAEADGISASEWLSIRLGEYLDAYGVGPRSA